MSNRTRQTLPAHPTRYLQTLFYLGHQTEITISFLTIGMTEKQEPRTQRTVICLLIVHEHMVSYMK